MSSGDTDEILTAIHSKLALIDGKTTMNVRADRDKHIAVARKLVTDTPLVGQIYLAIDGKRTQSEVREALAGFGIQTSAMGVTRAFTKAAEYGLIELLPADGAGKVYGRDATYEKLLQLPKNIAKWLDGAGATMPVKARRKRTAKKKPTS